MPTFTLIQTATASSNTASLTISSIPATYTDLCIIGSYRSTVNGQNSQCNMQFNGDTGVNYGLARGALIGPNTIDATGTTNGANIRVVYVGPGATATANAFGTFVYYIYHYRSNYTKFIAGQDLRMSSTSTGDCYLQMQTNQWRNAGTISSITFFNQGGNELAAGCTFSLYGIKNS